ncbi:MAG: hypothetical protein COU33_03795 [Candidatus Magasanikbacteria bacterium CG10_big_fil_rev_8_21_14_0_10_43_6]|uniref:Nudix hydrolase domain-containing protein n=1 Tax=Candidatus Magasanikbacteria bacterium CG10_big_fil_rev_8_21_14_0_10_43_6 TaxID=1974650 RepID=A0A2M6W0J3_9BACT|nr:MAG: hypothetical protein COU33_03795 [Candidatus Magasanikbacteria bacterium CG10_big_fil_rev_8_21_14_0_10_43_6]
MKAPLDVFQNTVQYFPTVSINLVIQNAAGEFLFVKRKNNPAKGLYWIPGGRIFAGESLAVAAKRILFGEVGIDQEIDFVSHVFAEEIFDTTAFDAEDFALYTKDTHHVHYLATAAYVRLTQEATITLDSQSSDFLWTKKIPNKHPYVVYYFELVKKYIHNA